LKSVPARLLALAALLLVLLLGAGRAAADEDGAGGTEGAGALPPRDVAVVVQPAAVALSTTPADFARIDDGWLTLEFPSSVRDRVEALARDAQEFRAQLAGDLGQPVLDHVLVRVARSPEQMAELAPVGAPPPEYAAGVAYPSMHLALLALQAPDTWEAPDLVELMRHELTHVALSDAVSGHHVPRWFDEGFAIHESGELPWARLRTLGEASVGHHLLPLSQLDRGFPTDRYDVNVAYAESADFVRFLGRDDERARFGSLVERVRGGQAFERALDDAYDTDLRKLEYDWREDVSQRFGVVPMLTGGGLLWVLIVGLAIAAFVKRRRRARAKLAQWAREEAEMDAALAKSRERVVAASRPAEDDAPLPEVRPSLPLVEHEGRWYTLH
jgi:hypothetical protein